VHRWAGVRPDCDDDDPCGAAGDAVHRDHHRDDHRHRDDHHRDRRGRQDRQDRQDHLDRHRNRRRDDHRGRWVHRWDHPDADRRDHPGAHQDHPDGHRDHRDDPWAGYHDERRAEAEWACPWPMWVDACPGAAEWASPWQMWADAEELRHAPQLRPDAAEHRPVELRRRATR